YPAPFACLRIACRSCQKVLPLPCGPLAYFTPRHPGQSAPTAILFTACSYLPLIAAKGKPSFANQASPMICIVRGKGLRGRLQPNGKCLSQPSCQVVRSVKKC